MRIAIVQFPGSTCEREIGLAVERAGMEPVVFLWDEAIGKLMECEGYILVGDIASEGCASIDEIVAAPIVHVIKDQSKLGKPILGIGGGARILVGLGLVPGIAGDKVGVWLTDDKGIQQETLLTIRLSDTYQLNAFTAKLLPNTILNMPSAQCEVRFKMGPALLSEVQENGLNVFQYCDSKGEMTNTLSISPGDSTDNIAALSNKAGNVMAMISYPMTSEHGDAIFQSMREYIKKGYKPSTATLYYYPNL